MKVFVWFYHGDMSVYAADTYEQCIKIFDNIDDAIYEMNIAYADTMRKQLFLDISNARPEHRGHIVRDAISEIVEKFYAAKNSIFEYGTTFKDVKNV